MRIVDVDRLGGQVCTPTSEVASTGVNEELALLTMKPSHTPPWWNVGTMPTKERETILWDNGLEEYIWPGKTVIVMPNKLRGRNYENGLIISMTIG